MTDSPGAWQLGDILALVPMWRRREERKWLQRWRKQPPREAWVVLIDGDGNEVGPQIPITLRASAPGEFTTTTSVTWEDAQFGAVHSVRVIDADGVVTDRPIGWAQS